MTSSLSSLIIPIDTESPFAVVAFHDHTASIRLMGAGEKLNGSEAASIICRGNDLEFKPNIIACVHFFHDIIWFGKMGMHLTGEIGQISIGEFEITFDKPQKLTTVTWSGKTPTESFEKFQEEWNRHWDRYVKLSSFW